MNNLGQRKAEWGNWGITFSWSDGGYAPAKIEGTLYFPVGNCGPCDGYLGSSERDNYKAIVAAWMRDGVLPQNLAVR